MNKKIIFGSSISFFLLANSAQLYNVVIIGSGPAGSMAATYAGRAKLNPLVIEGNPGGTLMPVEKIQNWPCYDSISGLELMQQMMHQAKKAGATFVSDIATNVDLHKRPFTLTMVSGNTLQAETIVVATGMTPKKLGCPGEAEYKQKGICNCALCDAPLFDGQVVVIVGGGMMALQNAKFLTKYAKKIIIINNTNALTAPKKMVQDIQKAPMVTILNNCTVTRIKGDNEKVTAIDIIDQHHNERTIATDGVFVSIGYEPNTELFKGQLDINNVGKIICSPLGHTNVPGVFVAGSVGTIPHEQAIICAASGCIAAIEAGNFIGRAQPKNLNYRCQKEDLSVF